MFVQMIALKSQVYAGRPLKAGDPFLARGETDARILIAIGKAKRTVFESAPVALSGLAVSSVYIDDCLREIPSEAAALNVDPDPVPTPEPLTVINVEPAPEVSEPEPDLTTRRGRREYRRRDLHAEGDKS